MFLTSDLLKKTLLKCERNVTLLMHWLREITGVKPKWREQQQAEIISTHLLKCWSNSNQIIWRKKTCHYIQNNLEIWLKKVSTYDLILHLAKSSHYIQNNFEI